MFVIINNLQMQTKRMTKNNFALEIVFEIGVSRLGKGMRK